MAAARTPSIGELRRRFPMSLKIASAAARCRWSFEKTAISSKLEPVFGDVASRSRLWRKQGFAGKDCVVQTAVGAVARR